MITVKSSNIVPDPNQTTDQQIQTLRDKLKTTLGTPTEVYTRIVGYYRSIKNWNPGQREQLKSRVPYRLPEGTQK
jgi:hypothetical protein